MADRGPRRLLVVGGYALPAIARAGIAAALAPWQVLASRLVDRVGKGIRSGPRDAMLAAAAAAASGDVGRAFGLQRSLDHLGAPVGPLLAAGLDAAGASLRATFAAAAACGLAAPVLLSVRLRAAPSDPRVAAAAERGGPLPAAFWRYRAPAALFALGNSTDAFLLLVARHVGFSAAAVPLLWFGHHLVKTLAGLPGGALSDRVPRGAVLAAGWGAYALAYIGFAVVAGSRWPVAALFGLLRALPRARRGSGAALVADLAGPGIRGRAYGWYHGSVGIAALPAGIATGFLWSAYGRRVALLACAAMAAAVALLLAMSPSARRRAAPVPVR